MSYNHRISPLPQDLKPSNLLFAPDGTLKIGDFGMSVQVSGDPTCLHPNVVTLWYRAPELVLNSPSHSVAVDVWSAGCIFAELMMGKPLFGDAMSDLALVKAMVDLIGAPNTTVWPVRLCVMWCSCIDCD